MTAERAGLTRTLARFDLQAAHASRLVLSAPWGAMLPATDQPGLYVVKEGAAWIRSRPEERPIELVQGASALLPAGSAHWLSSRPDARTPPIAEFFEEHGGTRGVDLRGVGGGGREAEIDTFCFRMGSSNARQLVRSVPELIVLPRGSTLAWTTHIARALSSLLDSGRSDVDTASIGLMETLLGVALQELLTRAPADLDGADDAVTLALALVHADLAHPWTVATLARKVGRSKSAFHDQFARWTGRSPIDYLTNARMDRARELLGMSDVSVQAVAESVGYQTASAFAVAFRRWCGSTPSEARRAASRSPTCAARPRLISRGNGASRCRRP